MNKVGWHVFPPWLHNTKADSPYIPQSLMFSLAIIHQTIKPSFYTHIHLLTSFPSSITSASLLPLTPVPSSSLLLLVSKSANCHSCSVGSSGYILWYASYLRFISWFPYLCTCKRFCFATLNNFAASACIWMWVSSRPVLLSAFVTKTFIVLVFSFGFPRWNRLDGAWISPSWSQYPSITYSIRMNKCLPSDAVCLLVALILLSFNNYTNWTKTETDNILIGYSRILMKWCIVKSPQGQSCLPLIYNLFNQRITVHGLQKQTAFHSPLHSSCSTMYLMTGCKHKAECIFVVFVSFPVTYIFKLSKTTNIFLCNA